MRANRLTFSCILIVARAATSVAFFLSTHLTETTMDSRLINVLLLGLAFMVLFTAYLTTSMIQQSVIEGVKNETINGTGFQASGYVSLAISWGCMGIVNVFAPVAVSILGPAMSMFVSSFTYLLYVFSFVSPKIWSFYLVSVLLGIGGALLWTAEGTYLALNSDELTVSRNAGIFWALLQASVIPGNLYVYLSLDTEVIYRSMRHRLFIVFSIVCTIGILLYGIIVWRSLVERRRSQERQQRQKVTLADIGHVLNIAVRLLKTKNMLLLLILFAYTGFSATLFSTVYPTCIGHYIKYGDKRKRLIGLHGLIVGIGEILGSGLFGFITKPKTGSQRALIVLIAFVLQIISCYSIFVNIPFDAAARETDTKPYFELSSSASQVVTFTTSFLIGLGDSGCNTQLTSVLAGQYKKTSASAFAIYQLVQGIAAACAYLYAGSLGLQFQLLILTTFLVISTLAFFSVLFNEGDNELSEVPSVSEVDGKQIQLTIKGQHSNSSLVS